jgi:hypothetical protein
MAQTTGIVQTLTISTSQVCTQIGPSPNNVELLTINITSNDPAVIAFQTSMIDALAAALTSRRTIVASHGDQDAIISQVVINPA